MGFGWRLFIFENDGALRRIPQRIGNLLPTGGAKLPEYAGQRLRYAMVYLRTEGQRPVEAIKSEYAFFEFDRRGSAQRALAGAAMRLVETADRATSEAKQQGTVISVTARLERKAFERRERWAPTAAEMARIEAAIWPPKRNQAG